VSVIAAVVVLSGVALNAVTVVLAHRRTSKEPS
jgi:hypothetical protein